MSAAIVRYLELFILGACLLTNVRLVYNGLYKRYRALFAYLVFRFFYTGALLFAFPNTGSRAYLWFFTLTEPAIWLFYVLIVIELYSLVLEKHRGLYTLGRWVLYGGLTVSLLISGLALLPELSGGAPQRSRLIPYYLAIERGVDFSLLIFLLLILLWLTQYPVPLSRNVLVHSLAYSILFLSNTAGLLVRVMFGLNLARPVTTLFLAIGAICILMWLIFLTPKGEEVRVSLPSFGPEQEKRILSQLEALNKTLLKVSRE
ncbi:MAG TPA: hypothetical protein VKT49_15160 [Bryobacteraceae bacterium]|nr:hypothetical protein [Bryobacteraceae bacterium]